MSHIDVLYYKPPYIVVNYNDGIGLTVVKNMQYANKPYCLYKNVTNEIPFIIRNHDNKPIPLVAKKIYVVAYDQINKEIAFYKPLHIKNEFKGEFTLILNPEELENLDPGNYFYSLVMSDTEENIDLPLFFDQNYNVRGVFELKNGPYPLPKRTVTLLASSFTPQLFGLDIRYISSAMKSSSIMGFDDRLNSFAIYTTNWTGKVFIQATLETTPPTVYENWITLEEKSYTNFSGIDYLDYEGNFLWLRVAYQNDPLNTGTFDKILFRN